MKRSILITVFILSVFNVLGQDKGEDIINIFFKQYETNPTKAVEDIFNTSPYNGRMRDGIDNIKNELSKLTIDYVGKYYGHELIVKKQLSGSFVLYSYLIKYDRQPLRFIFKMYKPNDKWMLYSFKYDSNLDDELEQAAKLYYLNLDK